MLCNKSKVPLTTLAKLSLHCSLNISIWSEDMCTQDEDQIKVCYMYIISQCTALCMYATALIQWRFNALMEALLRNSLGKKKQHSAASSHRLITAPHKNYVFIHLTLRGNGFWKCWHKSLHALSRGGFTTLIKVAMRHIRLAVSTIAGPAEERGAERSITRGEEQGNNRR